MSRVTQTSESVHRTLRAGALAAGIIWAGAADASDTHYEDFPVGGRAVGLGGAFTAIADDPSGIFYNPAGLVDATRANVQVSANLYGLEFAVTEDDVLSSVAKRLIEFERVFAELAIIPSSAGFLEHFGPKDESGRYSHSWGTAVFVPEYRGASVRTVTEGPNPGELILYRRQTLDRALRPAAAYAYRIDDTWSFGVAGSVAYRSLKEREETSLVSDLSAPSQSFTGSSSELDAWSAALSFTFGIKASLDDRFIAGLSVTAPGVQVADSASLEVVRTFARQGSPTRLHFDRPTEIEFSSETGAAIRLGGAYVVPRELTVAVDLSMHAPINYRLLKVTASPTTLETLTLISEIERRGVIDLAIGIERLFSKQFSVAAGVYTNFSSAPDIPGESGARLDRAYLADVDGLGGSLVLGFFSDHTLTRVGLVSMYGHGEDVIPRSEELRPIGSGGTFRKLEVSQLFLYFFLSSTFRY
ncbi:MAG: hypothetical protein HYV07_13675 [Deltaproteobacteria bacterium]|nr:hypothetical protein [Deltaproteobacteria bacterium]